VIKIVNPYAYELELPAGMDIHPVFHVSLLKPAATDPHKSQRATPPPPVVVNDEDEYEVYEILDSKRGRERGSPVRYLVKWTGHGTPNWEFYENVKYLDALRKFHLLYPKKSQYSEFNLVVACFLGAQVSEEAYCHDSW
jgi:hypothetical protein